MKLRLTLAVATLLTLGLSSAAAHADTVNFTLVRANGAVPLAGGSFIYDATVSAPATNGAAVFLNGDSFNITSPISLNDSDFFTFFPLSLAPGTSFTGDLFVLTAPSGTQFVTPFLGTFTLLGGANGNASNTLGAVNFSLTATPEPGSVVLLLTGMGGLVMGGFRRNLRNWAR